MYDANLTLQAVTTKTATFSGAALNLITGTPRRGMYAHVFYNAAANASGNNNVYFQVDHSPDGANWYPLAYQIETPAGGGTQGIALSTTAQAGEANIKFDTPNPYVRLTCNVAGAGTSPTVTYSGFLEIGRP